MKFILDKKAKALVNKKQIKEIFINPDLDQKASCCGIATVDIVILTKETDKDRYKLQETDDLDIYYNPNLAMYIDEDEEIIISAFFKKLYIKNEINTIEK